jgi:hypothetical protein
VQHSERTTTTKQLKVEQNTNLTPQHQAETAPRTILCNYRMNFFQSTKEVKIEKIVIFIVTT